MIERWLSLRVALRAAVVGAVLLAVLDYLRFEAACQRVRETAGDLDARLGSIGGWPLGQEFVMPIVRDLTGDEVQQLAALRRFRRIHLHLYMDCDIPEARLDELSRRLAPYTVSNPGSS